MHLRPGTKLDGYEILGPLGAGGMGEVYRALDPALKREIAVKVLPSFGFREIPIGCIALSRKRRRPLNHPNILTIYRVGVFEGAPSSLGIATR
jgi:serine/threonine protein kinase